MQVAARILEGGAAKVREAGGVVAGGHTVIDIEPKYGLCVTGLVHPQRIRTVAGARPSDIIVLTKKLGTGVLISALQKGRAQAEHAEAAIQQMQQLNAAAARATHDLDVHAMTDVTGFGIGGHLIEIARSSGVGDPACDRGAARPGRVPRLRDHGTDDRRSAPEPGALRPRGVRRGSAHPEQEALLFDPQTAGGSSLCCRKEKAAACRSVWRMRTSRAGAWATSPRAADSPSRPDALSMASILDVAVIGGGIIGLATAMELTGRYSGLHVAVLEKEPRTGAHQSSHNSGVIHSGLYYRPGSAKAEMAVRGARGMMAFCDEHAIPYERCGKVVVATSAQEIRGWRSSNGGGGPMA